MLAEPREGSRRHSHDGAGHSQALAIVSLGTGIPITAIAGEAGGLVGILVAWIGIVAVNLAHGRRSA